MLQLEDGASAGKRLERGVSNDPCFAVWPTGEMCSRGNRRGSEMIAGSDVADSSAY